MKNGHKRVDVVRVELVKERSLQYGSAGKRAINRPDKAAELIRNFIGTPDRENFGIITVNTKHEPTHISITGVGSLNAAIIHPREVFKTAILANASSLFLFHNHPSGCAKPSPEDKKITERLVKAGELLGIKVLDHIIVGNDDETFFSFHEEGLI